MNYRKVRFIEKFVYLMFPATLLIACTTNGTDQMASDKLTSAEETLSIVREENPIFYADENDLRFGKALIEKVNTSSNELSWAIEESNDDKYVIVSPSMHLAIYKTTQGVQQDMQDSIHNANLKESNALNFPEKSVFHFNSDVYNLDEKELESLREHAEFLSNNPQFNLTIKGHTDHTGSAEYNQILSEQRAQLVMDILMTFGAPIAQIIAEGHGESVPLNSIDNLEENRRVELEYSRALMVSEM
ncbi:OmpA family protein [Kaarinaea lacus]